MKRCKKQSNTINRYGHLKTYLNNLLLLLENKVIIVSLKFVNPNFVINFF